MNDLHMLTNEIAMIHNSFTCIRYSHIASPYL